MQAWCQDTVTKHQKQESLDSALQTELAEIFNQSPNATRPGPSTFGGYFFQAQERQRVDLNSMNPKPYILHPKP